MSARSHRRFPHRLRIAGVRCVLSSGSAGGRLFEVGYPLNLRRKVAAASGVAALALWGLPDCVTQEGRPGCQSGAGTCQTIASADRPQAIAMDATSVYWTDWGPSPCEAGFCGRVVKTSMTGGVVTTLASSQDLPTAIAVDNANVYWANLGNSSARSGSIMKVGVDGGTPTTIVSGIGSPGGIAVDSAHLYWVDDTAVMSMPIGGGGATTLASSPGWSWSLASDGAWLVWTPVGGSPATPDIGTVVAASTAGGTPTTLASGQIFPRENVGHIAVAAARAYWVDYALGKVLSVPLAGGAVTTLAADQDQPTAVAVDATSVYWTNQGTYGSSAGTLMKVALEGGSPTTLAQGLIAPWAVAVGGGRAYVLALSVMKVTPN